MILDCSSKGIKNRIRIQFGAINSESDSAILPTYLRRLAGFLRRDRGASSILFSDRHLNVIQNKHKTVNISANEKK